MSVHEVQMMMARFPKKFPRISVAQDNAAFEFHVSEIISKKISCHQPMAYLKTSPNSAMDIFAKTVNGC